MEDMFDIQVNHPFNAYGPSHLVALSIFVAAVVLLFACRRWFQQGERHTYGRLVLAVVLIVSELSLNVWFAWTGSFKIRDVLPLELCTVSLYVCVVMLLFRSRAVFQIVYFTGIGGALQALLTPALDYAFPHFRFWQFFIAHGAIILAVMYMVWVEKHRPTLKSVAVTMGFLNVLAAFVWVVDVLTDRNYMFLLRKPDTASLLDVLGPYPWYILALEGIALLTFLLLYVPFALAARWGRKVPREVPSATYRPD
ncbi:YwaF family protein [Numidum massiliense]|uniref:YwaF family protein n=1 Tax=Numidum massiliense TaxID=1522315 RepID=UPI0006D52CD3|nr:TIGR02206 family membrane protein [Numidum massiliense]